MSQTKNTATAAPAPKAQAVKPTQQFLFDKSNYIWMLAGVALVILGFILMAGGKSEDPNKFNPDEIFSTTRITIAPLMILLGFAVEIYAIMKKPATAEAQYN